MAAIPPNILPQFSTTDADPQIAAAPQHETGAIPPDHIAAPSTKASSDLASAVGVFATGAWGAAARGAAQLGPSVAGAAGEIGSAIGGALGSPAAVGALAVGGGVIATAQPAGAANEADPNASWRQTSAAASDRATTMAAHPVQPSTTLSPVHPHTGSKLVTPADHHDGSTTTTPLEHATTSTTSTPAHSADRASAISGKPVGSPSSARDLMVEASKFKLTPSSGPPTQGLVDKNSPASVRNAGRIEALRGEMTSDTSGRATVAVAVAKDAHGNEINLISTNKGKYLQPNMKPQADEVPVGKRGADAEQNIVNYAHEKGLTLTDIAASRPICSNCENAIEATGAHISSPLKGSPARGNF